MKLFDAYRESGYHTTIATTFAIDFAAYEQIALSRLREAGCMNNIVLADARMLTLSLSDPQRPPRQAGRQYSLVGADAPGLFHPKLTLQLGVDRARLIVASANLTGSGLAGNLEVVGEVRVGADDEEHVALIQEALAFLERHIPSTETGACKQLEWARARAAWLQRPASATREPLATSLLVSGAEAIGHRLVKLVADEPVSRLVVMSPYWDENLGAVRSLQAALKPRTTALLIEPQRALFPGKEGVQAQLFDVGALTGPRDRFAHAKVVIVQTPSADHVLYGSTNCTVAALGAGTTAGANIEAALYRRMAPGAAVEALGMLVALDGLPLGDAAIEPYVRAVDIPLEQAALRQPGRFHLCGRQLTWTPAPAYDMPDTRLELLDVDQQLLTAAVPTINGAGRVLQLDLDEAPRFARARVGALVSAVGVVHIEEALLQNMRVMSSKKIQKALEKLAGLEVEGLLLYEALELIEAEETKFAAAAGRGAQRRAQTQTVPTATLTFDEFMRARASGPPPDRAPGSSLASSYVNEVRGCLNGLFGFKEPRLGVPDADDGELVIPLGMGDETADGESALESGGHDDSQVAPPPAPDETTTPPAAREADTEQAIAAAVHRFNERLDVAGRQRELTARDLLRARVLLTVILASGSTRVRRPAVPPAGAGAPVLLARGDVGWPRLAGQVLFMLFGTKMPAIHTVKLEAGASGAVPIDFLECLATCMWTVCALALARDEGAEPTEVATRAHKRAAEIYGMTMLESRLLEGETTMRVLGALSKRYAVRLGVDPTDLSQLHSQMVAAAPTLRAQWLAAAR